MSNLFSVCPYIRNAWLRSAGLKEEPLSTDKAKKAPTLEELRKSEWSPKFEKLMRNRMILGAMRYNTIADSDYSGYDLTGEAIRRIELYNITKNLEHLVDAANICLLGFVHGGRIGEKLEVQDDAVHAEWNGGAQGKPKNV